MEQEIKQLKEELKTYKKKVDDLYSVTQFPEQILNILYKKGLLRIIDTLVYSYNRFTSTDFIVEIADKKYVINMKPFENYIPFTVNTSTNVVTTNIDLTAYEDSNVAVMSTNTLPSPMDTSTSYQIKNVSGKTCQFYLTGTATLVDFTDKGIGTHYIVDFI